MLNIKTSYYLLIRVSDTLIEKICIDLLYVLVSKSTDVNECKEIPEPCGSHANCFNTNGSYYCQCKSGFENEFGPVTFTGIDGQCKGERVCLSVCDQCLSCPTSLTHLPLVFCQISMSASRIMSVVTMLIVLTGSGATSAPAILGTPMPAVHLDPA